MTSPADRPPVAAGQSPDGGPRLPRRVAGATGSGPETFVAPAWSEADRPVVDAAIRLVRELHVRGQGGCCNGCMALRQQVVAYTDCPQLAWVARVGAVPGVSGLPVGVDRSATDQPQAMAGLVGEVTIRPDSRGGAIGCGGSPDGFAAARSVPGSVPETVRAGRTGTRQGR
jgi:hypothetical protein